MSYFSYVGKLFTNVKGFYNEINAATLTGAIDVVIVQQEDGTYVSSPFHVRFGKLGVLRSREKKIDLEINGENVDLCMKLGESGEAFFVSQIEDEDVPSYLATSPIASSSDLMKQGVEEMKRKYLDESKLDESKPDQIVPDTNDQVVDNTNTVTMQVKTEEKEIQKKVHKKKRSSRKRLSINEEKEQNPDTHVSLFDMEDVSSDDEELANLPEMPPLGSMNKSLSLPIMEESTLQRTSQWASKQYNTSYPYAHPFSDTDISPTVSPSNTRPPSPTKSDTELDKHRLQDVDQSFFSEEDNTMWEWGHLPQTSPGIDKSHDSTLTSFKSAQSTIVPIPELEGQTGPTGKESSGGLFHFMRKSKSIRHKPETEGIYLDDLKVEEMDPEVAKLYFPKRKFGNLRDQQKKRFHQVPFVSIKDEDAESGRGASLPVSPHSVEGAIGGPPVSFLDSEVKHLGKFSMSLCGGLSDPEGVTLERFMQNVVTYEDLCENYNMINNPELVIRIDEKFYNWPSAAPMILSYVAFERNLKESVQNTIMKENMPKKRELKKGRVSSWFSWRKAPDEAEPNKLEGSASNMNVATPDGEVSNINKTQSVSDISLSPPVSNPTSAQGSPRKQRERKSTTDSVKADDEHSSSEETDSDKVSRLEVPRTDKFKKVLRLTSEQITKMHLKEGMNEVTFSVTTQYQGTTKCKSHIYLWHWNDKIVVSDIDGTITKSDVLGQILPIVGRDWSQSGVAKLYTNIASNGYKFLYLSARAIGQSKVTKDLLQSIKQETHVLPDGPLLLSPTSLVSAFHKEVIEKRPQDFKIACLKDIGSLFPNNVFYAGLGNKINDVYAYKALNIPPYRIFTINHKGELKQESAYTFQSSYLKLNDVADHFFPPVFKLGTVAPEYKSTHYWREPLLQIKDTDLASIATEPDPRLKS